jgi:hypothetical protein
MRERILTVVGIVAGIGVPAAVGVALATASGQFWWLVLPLPFVAIFGATARLAPKAYRLASDGLHVERRGAAPVRIAYRLIRSVDRQRRHLLGLGAGSNGFLGRFTFGRAWRPGLGRYRLLLSDARAAVWIDTSEGWVVVSPERADAFVAGLRARLTAPRPPWSSRERR